MAEYKKNHIQSLKGNTESVPKAAKRQIVCQFRALNECE